MLCLCGCGSETKKGNIYIHGHNVKSISQSKQPSGFCQCGCGQIIPSKRRYVSGHNKAKPFYLRIPALCLCGCNEIIWGSNEYKAGHNPRTEITKKKQSEAMQGKPAWNKGYGDYIKGEKHPLWGKHHTGETKLKMSSKNSGIRRSPKTEFKSGHKGMLGRNNPAFGKPSSKGSGWGKGTYYDSPLQGKIWLRSSYELAYVKYLDQNRILWLYELETFNLGDMSYTPDFFLPQFEKFVEIKGYIKEKALHRILSFKEQYPFDLDVLFRKDLLNIGVNIK